METASLEREQRSSTLENIRFSDISYQQCSRNKKGTTIVQETQFPIQIHGHEFELYVERTKKTGETMIASSYAFVIRNTDNGVATPNILAEALFIERDDHVAVTCSIQKENDHPSLAGAGLVIYKKVLDLVQDFADASKKKIIHTVTMKRSLSKRDTPLTTERWLALFGPTLEQHGYTRFDDRHWQKTYEGRLAN